MILVLLKKAQAKLRRWATGTPPPPHYEFLIEQALESYQKIVCIIKLVFSELLALRAFFSSLALV